jgi:hypothetical protein
MNAVMVRRIREFAYLRKTDIAVPVPRQKRRARDVEQDEPLLPFEVVMSFAKYLPLFGLAVSALVFTGCAAETDDAPDSEESPDSSEEDLSVQVQAGSFKLYADPGHQVKPGCDVYTKLNLLNAPGGRAHLREELSPTSGCMIAVFPNDREYRLKLSGTQCGSKIYTGTFTKNGQKHSVEITDHRTRMCMDLLLARVIVKETAPAPGSSTPVTTTKYAAW